MTEKVIKMMKKIDIFTCSKRKNTHINKNER